MFTSELKFDLTPKKIKFSVSFMLLFTIIRLLATLSYVRKLTFHVKLVLFDVFSMKIAAVSDSLPDVTCRKKHYASAISDVISFVAEC